MDLQNSQAATSNSYSPPRYTSAYTQWGKSLCFSLATHSWHTWSASSIPYCVAIAVENLTRPDLSPSLLLMKLSWSSYNACFPSQAAQCRAANLDWSIPMPCRPALLNRPHTMTTTITVAPARSTVASRRKRRNRRQPDAGDGGNDDDDGGSGIDGHSLQSIQQLCTIKILASILICSKLIMPQNKTFRCP